MIEANYDGVVKQFMPEEILAMIFDSLKKNADRQLGQNTSDCVITVPTYFNDDQR